MRAEELIAEASAQTGLDDFGGDSFREGLDVWCDAVEREAQLNQFGAIAVRANAVASLASRLKITQYRKEHPDVASESIEQPLIVVGLFRAGTTLLSHLLDKDPANRALLGWEAADPVPPPTPDNFRSGPRLDAVRAGQQMLNELNPALLTVHREEAGEATECLTLIAQDFKSLLWEALTNVPSYGKWLHDVDQLSAYGHHRRVLQVLQSGGVRGRWTLKSPHHAVALDPLTAVYPDAHLVVMHRDPVKLCGSVCSLIATLSGTFTDADHRSYIGEHWTAILETCIERVNVFRDANPDRPMIDVQYTDLTRDPAGTVARIYEATGSELSPDAARAMEAYVRDNPQGKFGAHSYDLADFGLNAAEVRERFAGYVDRYGVVLER
jgi:hypothetical protein